MIKAGYRCSIAHCNFRLRDAESDGDEAFVKKLGKDYGLEVHSKSFDTQDHATQEGISLQMAARQLRYDWFEELRKEQGFDLVATAHNMDDVIETFFINLIRGTGIRGLSGIRERSGPLIRPLLFATREQIAGYARKHGISYREDSSNISTKYIRNKIRHNIIPQLVEINPGFKQGIISTIERLRNTETIYQHEIDSKKDELISTKGQDVLLGIDGLRQIADMKTFLFELISCYNFNTQTVDDIAKSLDGPSGKQFFSDTHRLVKDREHLIISKLKPEDISKYYIDDGMLEIKEPVRLDLMTVNRSVHFLIPSERHTACLDYDKLIFPLILRKWHPGDHFFPLGMTHMKKLSDYFIDHKFSLVEKENTWLLLSGENIVWVVGHRIDDRYKITDETSQICIARVH
jgi:tRNA(Ile)-lysidine synthase